MQEADQAGERSEAGERAEGGLWKAWGAGPAEASDSEGLSDFCVDPTDLGSHSPSDMEGEEAEGRGPSWPAATGAGSQMSTMTHTDTQAEVAVRIHR